jgi:hypothetical protein
VIFAAEYEFVLRATALAVVMLAWILVRVWLGQPVMHPWLGGLLSGLLASLAAAVGVIPGSGPIPEYLGFIGVMGLGLLFTAGVRYEATHRAFSVRDRIVWAAFAVIIGSLLVAFIPDTATRQLTRRVIVGVCIAGSLIWVPTLLKQGSSRLGTIAIGIFAIGVVIERTFPLFTYFSKGAGGGAGVFPYVRESDVFQVLAGGAAMIFFSAERARQERRALASQSSSSRSP